MSTSTAVGRTGLESWRVLRTPLLVTGAIVLGVIAVMIGTADRTTGPFSPDSVEPSGAKALATMLGDHGVDVHGTENLNDAIGNGAGRALLIAPDGYLSRSDWQEIRDADWGHLILLRPDSRALEKKGGVPGPGNPYSQQAQISGYLWVPRVGGRVSAYGAKVGRSNSPDYLYNA